MSSIIIPVLLMLLPFVSLVFVNPEEGFYSDYHSYPIVTDEAVNDLSLDFETGLSGSTVFMPENDGSFGKTISNEVRRVEQRVKPTRRIYPTHTPTPTSVRMPTPTITRMPILTVTPPITILPSPIVKNELTPTPTYFPITQPIQITPSITKIPGPTIYPMPIITLPPYPCNPMPIYSVEPQVAKIIPCLD